MKVQSKITRVAKTAVNSTNNIAVSMANGDTQWVNIKYVNTILDSLFLTGASPTALVGSEVSYEKASHKAGDKVIDANGVDTGKLFSKDGYRINKFRIEEVGAKGQKLEEVGFKIAKKMSLSGSLSGLSLKKSVPATEVVVPADETVNAEDIS